jgi:hypothetical protein
LTASGRGAGLVPDGPRQHGASSVHFSTLIHLVTGQADHHSGATGQDARARNRLHCVPAQGTIARIP